MKIVSRKISFLLTVLLTLALTETNASQGFDPFSPNTEDTETARGVLNIFEEVPAASATRKRKRRTSNNLPSTRGFDPFNPNNEDTETARYALNVFEEVPTATATRQTRSSSNNPRAAKRPRLSEDKEDLRRYYDNIPEIFILQKNNIDTLSDLDALVLSHVVGFWTLWDKDEDGFDVRLKEFRTELNGEIGDALAKDRRTTRPEVIYYQVRKTGYISPDIFEALDALKAYDRKRKTAIDEKIDLAISGNLEALTDQERRRLSRAIGQRASRRKIDPDDARNVRNKIKLNNTVDNENYRTKEGIKRYIEECHTENKEFESLRDFYRSLNTWLKNENIISRKFNILTLYDHIREMKAGVSRKTGQETEVTLSPNLTNYVNGLKHDAKDLMNNKLENIFDYLCRRMENGKLPTDSKKALCSEYLGWSGRYQGVEWKAANFSKKLRLIVNGTYDDLLNDFIAERNNGDDEEEHGNSVSADDIKN